MVEVVQVKTDGSDQFIELPEKITTALGWKEGDDVEFVNNRDGTFTIRKTEPVRWSRVIDSMFELDKHCNKINEQHIHISLPQFNKKEYPDGSHPMSPNRTEVLYLRMNPKDRCLYTCDKAATNKLQFVIEYDGGWVGNGVLFRSEPMISMSKPELLEIADQAMIHTENEHHCFLENLRYDHIDDDGVVHLKLVFGS